MSWVRFPMAMHEAYFFSPLFSLSSFFPTSFFLPPFSPPPMFPPPFFLLPFFAPSPLHARSTTYKRSNIILVIVHDSTPHLLQAKAQFIVVQVKVLSLPTVSPFPPRPPHLCPTPQLSICLVILMEDHLQLTLGQEMVKSSLTMPHTVSPYK